MGKQVPGGDRGWVIPWQATERRIEKDILSCNVRSNVSPMKQEDGRLVYTGLWAC